MHESLDPLAMTALWTASMRAREHERPDRLFSDPYAAVLGGSAGTSKMLAFEDGLLGTISSLSAPGSWLMGDYVSLTVLEAPAMAAWRAVMAAAGHPWRSGCDEPETWLAGFGWAATVTPYGGAGADFGRWNRFAAGDAAGPRGRYVFVSRLGASAQGGS